MATTVFLGSEIKLNVHIETYEGKTADDYEFTLEAWTNSSRITTFKKSDTIRIDENNRLLRIDTVALGAGIIKIKITAELHDMDFRDEYRTEVTAINTGILIRNPYET